MARRTGRVLRLLEPWTTGQAILYGTLAVGVLDGLAAIVTFGLRGTPPPRIFQGVAAFFVMNLVVIPLSAIGAVVLRWPGSLNGLLIHALLVGPPATIAAAKAFAGRKR